MENNKLTSIISIIVVVIWAISMVVNMFSTTYQPPVGIYPALMMVLGGLFGYRLVRGSGGGLE